MEENQESGKGPKNSESLSCTLNNKPPVRRCETDKLESLASEISESQSTSKQNDNNKEKKQDKKSTSKEQGEIEEASTLEISQPSTQRAQAETPEEKALRNPLVVKTILRYLKVSSVLKCRLLNKLWLSLSTELLQKTRDEDENALRIKFHYCEEPASYVKYFDSLLLCKVKTLESFNAFLALALNDVEVDDDESIPSIHHRRWSFPCKNFEFRGLDLSHPEIQEFFQLYGSEIKGLRLGFSEKDQKAVNQESLTDLLMHKAKNVETLTILYAHYSLDFDPNQNESQNEAQDLPIRIFTLPHLRCLRLYFYSSGRDGGLRYLDEKLILASPGLRTIHLATPTPFFIIKDHLFDYLTSEPISKAHLITRLNIRPTVKNIEVLTQFAQSHPRLTHLTLSLKFVDNYELMRSSEYTISFEKFLPFALLLLESSKETLKYFHMPSRKTVSRFLKCEEFPLLKKVREVGFCCDEKIPTEAFNRIFPNAWKLSLMGEEAQSEYKSYGWGTAAAAGSTTRGFPMSKFRHSSPQTEIGEIPQITSLKLSGCFAKEFWHNLSSIFCNVEKLAVKNDDLLPVLPLVWSLQALPLKVLKLTIPVDGPLEEDFAGPMGPPRALIFPGLDAAITGFEEDACLEMHAIYPELVEEEIVRQRRVNSSILDLKYLEELYVKFQVSSTNELPEDILTVVSGAYAFQRMKSDLELESECELGLKKVQITTEIPPQKHGREISILDSRRRQAEEVLKPLVPFANVTFKLGAIYSESEDNPIERNCCW